MFARLNPFGKAGVSVAKEVQNLANSNTLRTALRNYIQAVNQLPPERRSETNIRNLILRSPNANTPSYNKRIVNGVSRIVVAARKAVEGAVNAAVGIAPAAPAAAQLNNVSAKIVELNKFMNSAPKGFTPNQFYNFYKKSGRNPANNRAVNNSRGQNGPRYGFLWNNINSRSNNQNGPVVVNKPANNMNNRAKRAAQLVYNQAYGGLLGSGVTSGQWTVNKSVKNLTNNKVNSMRFAGLNKNLVYANLNARPNRAQANRAKQVFNKIMTNQRWASN
jgi:hypothetical protein